MLKISFEFRKGIFFVRLIGELNKNTYHNIEGELQELIMNNRFKYIVVNTNYLETIDIDGINYITKILCVARENNSNLVICDRTNMFETLFNNNVPNIKDELEVL